MTRIEKTFSKLNGKNRAALVCYITAGDPSVDVTKDIVIELEKSGADIIELGVPFSDPMADGPTIQLASERALSNGTTVTDALEIVKSVRRISEIPIILFGYYNPFLAYGLEKFSTDLKEVGADGVLVVDLPPEEAGEFKTHLENNGLDLIFLLAPNSDSERIRLVSDNATGFIYLVSVTGVTGARPDMDYSLQQLTDDIRRSSGLPVGIGFGVSSPSQAEKISNFADAVIVGSALVKIVEEAGNKKEILLGKINNFVSSLSKSCIRN